MQEKYQNERNLLSIYVCKANATKSFYATTKSVSVASGQTGRKKKYLQKIIQKKKENKNRKSEKAKTENFIN